MHTDIPVSNLLVAHSRSPAVAFEWLAPLKLFVTKCPTQGQLKNNCWRADSSLLIQFHHSVSINSCGYLRHNIPGLVKSYMYIYKNTKTFASESRKARLQTQKKVTYIEIHIQQVQSLCWLTIDCFFFFLHFAFTILYKSLQSPLISLCFLLMRQIFLKLFLKTLSWAIVLLLLEVFRSFFGLIVSSVLVLDCFQRV